MLVFFLLTLNLHGLQSLEWVLPLDAFEVDRFALIIRKVSVDVGEELGREHDKTTLIPQVASLHDEGMVLVAFLPFDIELRLEEELPKDGDLSHHEVRNTELHWVHLLLLRKLALHIHHHHIIDIAAHEIRMCLHGGS